MESASRTASQLAPPGAGIPAIERFIGGLIFSLKRWRGSREKFAAQFQRERGLIASHYHHQLDRILRQRVLIPRLRGLEDSSRFWSVWMTLDHLRIVNVQIAEVINDLTHGRSHQRVASTAAVKPSPDVGPDVAAAYEASCDQLTALVASCPPMRTSVRHVHPWFGPLDAAGWHALAAVHTGIHRAQIASILSRASVQPS